MTSKEFRIWLEGFLTPLNLENAEIRTDYGAHYNHLTMLKTIHDKLKDVKDLNEMGGKSLNNLLTERRIPVIISGIADGITIQKMIFQREQPKILPISTNESFTCVTPA